MRHPTNPWVHEDPDIKHYIVAPFVCFITCFVVLTHALDTIKLYKHGLITDQIRNLVKQEIVNNIRMLEDSSFVQSLEDRCICELQFRNDKKDIDGHMLWTGLRGSTYSHARRQCWNKHFNEECEAAICDPRCFLCAWVPDVRLEKECYHLAYQQSILEEVDIHGLCDIRSVKALDLPAHRIRSEQYCHKYKKLKRGIAKYGHMGFRRVLMASIIRRVGMKRFEEGLKSALWDCEDNVYAKLIKVKERAYPMETNLSVARNVVMRLCGSAERKIRQTVPQEVREHILAYIVWDDDHNLLANRLLGAFVRYNWRDFV